MRVRSRLPLLTACILAGVACAGDGTGLEDGNNGGSGISFAEDIQPIFTNSCAFAGGCHAGGSPALGMNLSAGQAYQNIVSVPADQLSSMNRIEPGEPDNSYLIHKIQGTQSSVGGTGQRMPLTGCCLSQTQIDLIRAWVNAGAENN